MANTLTSLGTLQERTEPQRALKTYDEALEIRERLVRQFPNVPEYRYRLGDTLYDRARSLGIIKDFPGTAGSSSRRSLPIEPLGSPTRGTCTTLVGFALITGNWP